MSVDRIELRFQAAHASKRAVLLPYFTSGFPDGRTVADLIRASDALGATVVEIGVPYSDSIADGPVIQESFNYALDQGHKVKDAFDLIARVRPAVECGLVMMLSYSIVHRIGLDRFMRDAAAAGADGVILPDVPIEEANDARAAAASANLCHIGLVAPSSSPARRAEIARGSTGFVYQIAAPGTTGERTSLPPTLTADVANLRRHTTLPICVGFGISTAAQVGEVCQVADGAILGSALIRRIADALRQRKSSNEIVTVAGAFLRNLLAGGQQPVAD